MKTKPMIIFLAMLAAGAIGRADEETIAWEQVPASVQRTVEANEKGPVKKVIRHSIDGKTTYEVELERDNAINPRLLVAEDGTLLRPGFNTTDTYPLVDPYYVGPIGGYDSMLRIEDLPGPVQATVQKQAAGREIADLDREQWEGRTVYEVEFREKGRNAQIHVAEDGTLLQEERKPKGVKAWFKGTQLEDTPSAVQETIKREARGGEIVDIDKENSASGPIYEVEFRDAQQASFELRIASDGHVVSDDR